MARKDPSISAVTDRRPESMSKVTNRNALFLERVDGRTAWPRRFRDLLELHHTDLGGHDRLSEGERQIVRRIATLEVELERMEGEFAVAGTADVEKLDVYIRASGSLKRLLEAVGLRRRHRDVTPTVAEWVADRQKRASK